jgi:hypothetical protein
MQPPLAVHGVEEAVRVLACIGGARARSGTAESARGEARARAYLGPE